MNANHNLERRVADYYMSEAPSRAPDWVLRSALESIDTTKQRRALVRVPWRFPNMNIYARVAVAAVAVVAVSAVGLSLFGGGSSGPGGQPSPSPSASPSPSPSASPSPSPVVVPALTGTFTSARHGISISYPAGWDTRAATEPWTTGFPTFSSADGDLIYEPILQDHLFLLLASRPLAGQIGEQWADAFMNSSEWGDTCDPPIESVVIGSAPGKLVVHCGGSPSAVAWLGDRGYLVIFYISGDNPELDAAYDVAFFREVIATIQLHPEDAVDTASSASPSASP